MIREQIIPWWDAYYFRLKFRALIRLGFHFRSGSDLRSGEFETQREGKNYVIRWCIPVDNINQLKLTFS